MVFLLGSYSRTSNFDSTTDHAPTDPRATINHTRGARTERDTRWMHPLWAHGSVRLVPTDRVNKRGTLGAWRAPTNTIIASNFRCCGNPNKEGPVKDQRQLFAYTVVNYDVLAQGQKMAPARPPTPAVAYAAWTIPVGVGWWWERSSSRQGELQLTSCSSVRA